MPIGGDSRNQGKTFFQPISVQTIFPIYQDEELLSVAPQDNALTLAYRDADTLRFVKRVTDAANARLADTGGQGWTDPLVKFI